MSTDGVIDRSTTEDTPIDPMASYKGRTVVWNLCRGNHLGQRSCASAFTGRTYGRNDLIKTLPDPLRRGGRPHMCLRRPGSIDRKDSRVPPSLSDTDAHELRVRIAAVDNAAVIQGDGLAMPIRPELRPLYPPYWRELSSHVRFERAQGRCQRCGRPHLVLLRCLPDGRWSDEQAATWRDRRGRPARWPDLMEADAGRARSGAPGQRSDQQSAKEFRA